MLNDLVQPYSVPHPATSFADTKVNVPILRQRAHNYRWATQPTEVIPLTAADSDFPVAPQIIVAMQTYLQAGYLPYGPPAGLPEFRAVVAQTLQERKAIPCQADQIFAVNSAASALYLVARFALTQPGDEAIIADPVDFLFERSVVAAGGQVKRFSLRPENNYSFDPAEIISLITPGKTKLLSICNPHNPLGRVWTQAELTILAEIALQHNLWLMSDEVWADIVYTPHTATASLGPEIAQRTFSIMGFSKSYGLAGLRLGVLVSPTSQIQQTMLHLAHADETAYGVSTMSQIAGIAAYQQAQDWLAHFVAHLQTQRDYALTRLNAMPGIECHTPEGTFVLFPNVSAYGLEASTLADYLQQQHGLAVVPGSPQFFGPAAQGHLRLSYATSREILAQGLDRLEHGLAALR